MSGALRALLAVVSAVLLCPVSSPPVAAGRVTVLMVDDDGAAAVGDCSADRRAFRRIQTAIDASGPRGTVFVCPGTYTERLKDLPERLTLRNAARTRPVIRAPVSAWDVVSVGESRGVTIQGFTIRPHGGEGTCAGVLALVSLGNVGSVRLIDDRLVAAWPFNGSCGGYGIGADSASDSFGPVASEVYARDTVFRDFGWAGISLHEFGHGEPTVLVSRRNRFEQRHRPAIGTPIAISFSGRSAEIRDNVIVSYGDRAALAGVRVWGDGLAPALTIVGNTLRGGSTGLDLQRVSSALIEGNTLIGHHAAADGDGIRIGGESYRVRIRSNIVSGFHASGIAVRFGSFPDPIDARVRGNDFRGNGGVDCVDETTGGGTAGTSNTWIDNLGTESAPTGICSPST